MEEVILKFAASARAAGMRISTAEVMDCLRQLPRVDVLDETQFATVLRSHFAKSRLELARFEHLYHLFFHELREGLDAASMAFSLASALSANPFSSCTESMRGCACLIVFSELRIFLPPGESPLPDPLCVLRTGTELLRCLW